jgi:hypothetical protein
MVALKKVYGVGPGRINGGRTALGDPVGVDGRSAAGLGPESRAESRATAPICEGGRIGAGEPVMESGMWRLVSSQDRGGYSDAKKCAA